MAETKVFGGGLALPDSSEITGKPTSPHISATPSIAEGLLKSVAPMAIEVAKDFRDVESTEEAISAAQESKDRVLGSLGVGGEGEEPVSPGVAKYSQNLSKLSKGLNSGKLTVSKAMTLASKDLARTIRENPRDITKVRQAFQATFGRNVASAEFDVVTESIDLQIQNQEKLRKDLIRRANRVGMTIDMVSTPSGLYKMKQKEQDLFDIFEFETARKKGQLHEKDKLGLGAIAAAKTSAHLLANEEASVMRGDTGIPGFKVKGVAQELRDNGINFNGTTYAQLNEFLKANPNAEPIVMNAKDKIKNQLVASLQSKYSYLNLTDSFRGTLSSSIALVNETVDNAFDNITVEKNTKIEQSKAALNKAKREQIIGAAELNKLQDPRVASLVATSNLIGNFAKHPNVLQAFKTDAVELMSLLQNNTALSNKGDTQSPDGTPVPAPPIPTTLDQGITDSLPFQNQLKVLSDLFTKVGDKVIKVFEDQPESEDMVVKLVNSSFRDANQRNTVTNADKLYDTLANKAVYDKIKTNKNYKGITKNAIKTIIRDLNALFKTNISPFSGTFLGFETAFQANKVDIVADKNGNVRFQVKPGMENTLNRQTIATLKNISRPEVAIDKRLSKLLKAYTHIVRDNDDYQGAFKTLMRQFKNAPTPTSIKSNEVPGLWDNLKQMVGTADSFLQEKSDQFIDSTVRKAKAAPFQVIDTIKTIDSSLDKISNQFIRSTLQKAKKALIDTDLMLENVSNQFIDSTISKAKTAPLEVAETLKNIDSVLQSISDQFIESTLQKAKDALISTYGSIEELINSPRSRDNTRSFNPLRGSNPSPAKVGKIMKDPETGEIFFS